MDCRDALELVEPIAAGDLEVSPAMRDHVESCPRCAAALATARHLELLLTQRLAPAAPERFGATVAERIRRDRWQTEQRVDRLFNVAIVAAIVLLVSGTLALTNLQAVLTLTSRAAELATLMTSRMTARALPVLPAYLGAAALLASALVTWWWAERRLTL